MHQFPPFLSHGDWQLYPGALDRDISIFRQIWREGELEKDTFKRSVWGTVSSFCAKIPCFTPPTNIYLSEQVFLHCYDKCVCIMKVGVKWPHSDPCVAFVSCKPFSLQGQTLCSSAYMCVWWMKLGHFFQPCFSFWREDQYSTIQNGGWRLTVSFPLSTPFPLTRGWALFWLMSF